MKTETIKKNRSKLERHNFFARESGLAFVAYIFFKHVQYTLTCICYSFCYSSLISFCSCFFLLLSFFCSLFSFCVAFQYAPLACHYKTCVCVCVYQDSLRPSTTYLFYVFFSFSLSLSPLFFNIDIALLFAKDFQFFLFFFSSAIMGACHLNWQKL